jgi:Domain of unknown function (DUF4397)
MAIAVAVAIAALASATAVTTSASATPPTNVGYVRLAHLSPDTPDVDVYLDSISSTQKEQVFHGVGYGTMSGYLPLPIGSYTVSMRGAGAPASSKPVISAQVTVLAGHAYTVAGVGKHADLGLRVITDNLSSPMNGHAKIRIVQASIKAPLLDVGVDGGSEIATQVAFATTTNYFDVTAGNITLRVSPSGGGTPVELPVSLQADSVYSVLVLDGANNTLTAQLRIDAARTGPVPKGAIETGAGGTASHSIIMPALIVAIIAFAGAIVLVATRRRPLSQWSPPMSKSKTPARTL